MSSSPVVLTFSVNTIQTSYINEGTLSNVLKHITPVPKITLEQKDCLLKYFIILETRETVKKVIEALESKRIELTNLKVLCDENEEVDAFKDSEHQFKINNQKERLTKNLKLGCTNGIPSVKKFSDKTSKYFNLAKNHTIERNSCVQESLPSHYSLFKENKGKVYPHKKMNLININECEDQLFKDKLNINDNKNTKKKLNLGDVGNAKTFIQVENLDKDNIDPSILFNLFGIIGNVVKMLVNIDRGLAIVEMEQAIQAELACNYFDNIKLFNTKIIVSSYPTQINWKDLYISPESNIRLIGGNSKFYRYKPNLNIKINQPSKIIHVTNVAPILTLANLCKLFSNVNEPSMITKLEARGKKSNMYLVEFQSEKESLEVLTTYHDQVLNGLRLKLSFSHMKVNKPVK